MNNSIYKDSELQMLSQLILCIEEKDSWSAPKCLDTRVFLGWSKSCNEFFIRGKRNDTKNKEFVPYAFQCKDQKCIIDFVDFIIDNKSNVSLILYNYNNIELLKTEELTYEIFEENMDRNYEVTGYDNMSLNKKSLKMLLGILKMTYNAK